MIDHLLQPLVCERFLTNARYREGHLRVVNALAKYPDQTRVFVRSSNLPEDVVKLYIRKARESFRTRTVEAL